MRKPRAFFADHPARARWLAASGLAAAHLFGSSLASGGDEQELKLARDHVDAAPPQYDKAAARFGKLLDPAGAPCPKSADVTPAGCRLTDRAMIEQARGLYAIALTELKRAEEAKNQFKSILLSNPTYNPSAAEFPLEVIKLFTEAKKEIEDQLTQKMIDEQRKKKELEDAQKRYDDWVVEIEKLAATETVVAERSRWIAAIPFGVGQFQNDQIGLGVFFMAFETAQVASVVVTSAMHAYYAAQSASAVPAENVTKRAQVETLKIANIVSVALLGATIIAGIIEAEVNFEAATPVPRPRKLPPKPPKPAPIVSLGGVPAVPEAYGAGITVAF